MDGVVSTVVAVSSCAASLCVFDDFNGRLNAACKIKFQLNCNLSGFTLNAPRGTSFTVRPNVFAEREAFC